MISRNWPKVALETLWAFPLRFRHSRFRYVPVAFPLRFRQRVRRVSVDVSIAPLGNCLPDKYCPKTPAAPTKSAMTNTAMHKTAVRKQRVAAHRKQHGTT